MKNTNKLIMSTKTALFLIISFLFVTGCQNNKKNITCRTVPEVGLIDCYFAIDSNFRVYFDSNQNIEDALILKQDGEGYENVSFYIDNNNSIRNLKSIDITPNEKNRSNYLTLSYNSKGQLISNKIFHVDFDECFYKEKIPNGYTYKVLYYLFNLKKWIPVYHFTLSEKDEILTDYFYYVQNENKSYTLVTDNPSFVEKNTLRDSLFIEYCESSIKDIEFISPDKYNYFPDLRDKKTKKIYSIKETIPYKKEPGIVADMWGFFKAESEYPFAYSMLFFNGDLLQRIKNNRSLFEQYEQKYPSGKIADYPSLKKSLLQVGFIEKDGKFEAGPQLKKKVQEIIDRK